MTSYYNTKSFSSSGPSSSKLKSNTPSPSALRRGQPRQQLIASWAKGCCSRGIPGEASGWYWLLFVRFRRVGASQKITIFFVALLVNASVLLGTAPFLHTASPTSKNRNNESCLSDHFVSEPTNDHVQVQNPLLRYNKDHLLRYNKDHLMQMKTHSSSPQPFSEEFEPLLSVPFYVYEELLWYSDAMLLIAGQNEPTISLRDFRYAPTRGKRMWNEKHADDFWFVQAALKHPLRTRDPAAAKLFVIPALLNHWSDFPYGPGGPVKAFCMQTSSAISTCLTEPELWKSVNDFLGASAWFQRFGGADHIMVASHWATHKLMHSDRGRYRHLHNLRQVHQITFEKSPSKNLDRLYLPSFYMGIPCPGAVSYDKTSDVAMVANMKFPIRRDVCHWIYKHNISCSLCGSGDQCPSLAQARYGFHIAGDTLGANRLIDTLLSGTVPIMTELGQYDILPTFIDWKSLTVFVDRTVGETAFVGALETVLRNETLYHEKREAVLSNRELFDWRTGIPFDVYMHAFELQVPVILQTHGRDNRTVGVGTELAVAVSQARKGRQRKSSDKHFEPERSNSIHKPCSIDTISEVKVRLRFSALLF